VRKVFVPLPSSYTNSVIEFDYSIGISGYRALGIIGYNMFTTYVVSPRMYIYTDYPENEVAVISLRHWSSNFNGTPHQNDQICLYILYIKL